jgi:DNA-binding HxlR family transcriptional regulator
MLKVSAAMKESAAHPPALCAKFHHASELIGRRWTGAIIYVLLQRTCRFATLRDAIPGITDRMLSERLQELEDEGLVERAVVPDTPVRVEYSLTRKGKGLAEAIETLSNWAEKNISLTAATKPRARRRAAR